MPSNNYIRQKTAEIQDNLVINASIFNAEYNQIQLAFSYAGSGETGHTHSGAVGEGGAIGKIGNQDFSKSLEISTNDWVFTGSSVQPATNNTTDLGVSGKGWKDVYISGNVAATTVTVGDGTSTDLKLYKDGSNNCFIEQRGSGGLEISGIYGKLSNESNQELISWDTDNAALSWRGASGAGIKLNTNETGINVTGIIDCDGLKMDDGQYAQFGTGNDLKIWHSGNNSFIQESGVGQLVLTTTNGSGIYVESAGEAMGQFVSNGAVNLYHDGVQKFATTETGIDVTGTVTADSLAIQPTSGAAGASLTSTTGQSVFTVQSTFDGNEVDEVAGIEIGAKSLSFIDLKTPNSDDYDLRIYHSELANHSMINALNEDLFLRSGGKVSLQHAGANTKLETTATGIDVTGTVNADAIKFTTDATDNAKIFIESSGGEQTSLVIQSKDNLDDFIILRHHIANVGEVDILTTRAVGATFRGDLKFKPQTGNPTGTFSISQLASGSGLIQQVGDGNILIKGQEGYVQNNSGDALVQWGASNVSLHWRGAGATGTKLVTTATGIDVTGTTNTDNLTINGAQGSDGQVLTSTGSGVAWEDAATGGGGSVTAVTGTAPIVSSGGTAPAISITQASGSTNGYLSSTDWNTFNNKGGGVGTLTGVTEGAAIDINTANAASPTISVDLSELPVETDDLVGSTDHLVYLNNGNQKRILANNVNLSAFNNDVGWTNNTGTVTSVSGGTGITVTGGGTSPSVSITSDSIGATQLNVTGNGAATDFLRSDGDGTFTWATPPETVYTAGANISISNGNVITNNGIRSINAGNGISVSTFTGVNTPTIGIPNGGVNSLMLNLPNTNPDTSKYLRSDGSNGFVWDEPTDTDTTYSAAVGGGLNMTGNQFSLDINTLTESTDDFSNTADRLAIYDGSANDTRKITQGRLDVSHFSRNNALWAGTNVNSSAFGGLEGRYTIFNNNVYRTVSTGGGALQGVWNFILIGSADLLFFASNNSQYYVTTDTGSIIGPKTSGTVTIKAGSKATIVGYGVGNGTLIFSGTNITTT